MQAMSPVPLTSSRGLRGSVLQSLRLRCVQNEHPLHVGYCAESDENRKGEAEIQA